MKKTPPRRGFLHGSGDRSLDSAATGAGLDLRHDLTDEVVLFLLDAGADLQSVEGAHRGLGGFQQLFRFVPIETGQFKVVALLVQIGQFLS